MSYSVLQVPLIVSISRVMNINYDEARSTGTSRRARLSQRTANANACVMLAGAAKTAASNAGAVSMAACSLAACSLAAFFLFGVLVQGALP